MTRGREECLATLSSESAFAPNGTEKLCSFTNLNKTFRKWKCEFEKKGVESFFEDDVMGIVQCALDYK